MASDNEAGAGPSNATASPSDIMNDPAFGPRTTSEKQGPDEGDTCRICRGEGSPEEPLFYPCKCSGSIKFVHQDCLMEWLSHSQKKYCELCKTPFRFTKLYHPQMPSQLPTTVFCRRALMHFLGYIISWCRAVLVAFVWLFALPLMMRLLWRWMFYFGDAGWAREAVMKHPGENQHFLSVPVTYNGFNETDISQAVSRTIANLTNPSSSSQDALLWPLARKFFSGLATYDNSSSRTKDVNGTFSNVSSQHITFHQDASLLSNVTFFKSFVVSDAINRTLIDVVEGQIITLVVVAAFILIFLIREWVVQQQPMLNMGAFGGAGIDNAERARQMDARRDALAAAREALANDANNGAGDLADDTDASDVDEILNAESSDELTDSDDDDSTNSGVSVTADQRFTAKEKVLAASLEFPPEIRDAWQKAVHDNDNEQMVQVLRSLTAEDMAEHGDKIDAIKRDLITLFREPNRSERSSAASSGPTAPPSSDRRPTMPSRDQSSVATAVHRVIEENSPEPAESSSQSSESWQDVTRPDDEDAIPRKERATEATDHSSQSAVETVTGSANDWSFDTIEGEQDAEQGASINEASTSEQSAETSQDVRSQQDDELLGPTGSASRDNDAPNALHEPRQEVPSEAAGVPTEGLDDQFRNVDQPGPAVTRDASQHTNAADDQQVHQRHIEVQRHETAVAIQAQQSAVEHIPRSFMEQLIDWFWGDIAPADVADVPEPNDEHIVRDVAEEAPFVPFNDGRPAPERADEVDDEDDTDDEDDGVNNEDVVNRDPEVARAAAEAGIDVNDQDAIEDAEDLEGILELIGQQGPITGLFQNAVFSILLIGLTLAVTVFLPYMLGKAVLLLMGSPVSVFLKMPLRIVSGTADLIIDCVLFLTTAISFSALHFLQWYVLPAASEPTVGSLLAWTERTSESTKQMALNAGDRIYSVFMSEVSGIDRHYGIDPLWLSTRSHVILKSIQNTTGHLQHLIAAEIALFCNEMTSETWKQYLTGLVSRTVPAVKVAAVQAGLGVYDLVHTLWEKKSLTVSLAIPKSSAFVDAALMYWNTWDRVSTVLLGYTFIAACGALYLRRGSPITSTRQGRKVEAVIAEVLQQAGGIFKVILIISIEMIAFPLYCGILLDVALLPLFAGVTLQSRHAYALQNPWTAGFVHWFVGTCYMFHFALFVSMCRKIMRKGVLYFIRDPDDPTFHPVRDVLERNITTQLRKITFSAMVYGVLIIFCLGGVIWTLKHSFSHVLPIRWATHEPTLEFPLGLLFFNFLTPVVIKTFKPADALHSLYKWWFQKCAKFLRLSDFLFGGAPKDEQSSTVRRAWKVWVGWMRGQGDVELNRVESRREVLPATGETRDLPIDGRFVRAPASDQVRIPRGETVFVDVDRNNKRLDGKSDDTGAHGRQPDMVTMVYIPPLFRLRISLFIASLWLFAAATGVGLTIIPLMFGRQVFSFLIPSDIEINDIYAFALGVYMLGGALYAITHARTLREYLRTTTTARLRASLTHATTFLKTYTIRLLSFIYVYTAMFVALPLLLTATVQLYVLIPIHTYMGPPAEQHVVFLVQDWTLGFLYARIIFQLFFAHPRSRPGRVLNAVMREGYMWPDARLATRCLVLPVILLCTITFGGPALIALLGNAILFRAESEFTKRMVFRASYPLVAAVCLNIYMTKEVLGATTRWRGKIKDEVYLIGERLHNFGERRPGPATIRVAQRVEGARGGDGVA